MMTRSWLVLMIMDSTQCEHLWLGNQQDKGQVINVKSKKHLKLQLPIGNTKKRRKKEKTLQYNDID